MRLRRRKADPGVPGRAQIPNSPASNGPDPDPKLELGQYRSLHQLALANKHKEEYRMADPRAFISFDYDHDELQKTFFAGQGKKDSPTPFTIGDWSSKAPLPDKTWEESIAIKIGACNMVIVLVGNTMASASGVAKEIAMAHAVDVPVFGVYVDGAGASTALPARLQRNRTLPWKWDLIAAMIEQAMGEGKNA
jgi:hypothetical protein